MKFSYGIKNKRYWPGIEQQVQPKRPLMGFGSFFNTSQRVLNGLNTGRSLFSQAQSFIQPLYSRIRSFTATQPTSQTTSQATTQTAPAEVITPEVVNPIQATDNSNQWKQIKDEVREIKKRAEIQPPFIPDF